MATVHPQSPRPTATPLPLPPTEEPHGDAASGDPVVQADAGGEIAALDKQLTVVVSSGGGEERKSISGAACNTPNNNNKVGRRYHATRQ
jgi:hypothetical protein